MAPGTNLPCSLTTLHPHSSVSQLQWPPSHWRVKVSPYDGSQVLCGCSSYQHSDFGTVFLNLLWPHSSPATPQIYQVHSYSTLDSLSACDALSPNDFKDSSPIFFLFFFSERGRQGEERKRTINRPSPACAPRQGPNPQPSHIPWLGIKLVTPHFAGWHSTEPHQSGLIPAFLIKTVHPSSRAPESHSLIFLLLLPVLIIYLLYIAFSSHYNTSSTRSIVWFTNVPQEPRTMLGTQ